MKTTQKLRTNFFKVLLVMVAAGVPILITSSYKTEVSARTMGFQKSINQVPKKKKIDPNEQRKKYENLFVY